MALHQTHNTRTHKKKKATPEVSPSSRDKRAAQAPNFGLRFSLKARVASL